MPEATPDPALEISSSCAAVRMRVLGRGVSALFDAHLRPHGLQVNQLNLLVAIAHLSPCSPAALQEALLMDQSTVSRHLRRLQDRGWVERVPDARDGRRFHLRPTRAGRALLRRVLPAWREAQAEVEALLGDLLPALFDAAARVRAA